MRDVLWICLSKKKSLSYFYIERDDLRIGVLEGSEKFLPLAHNIILPPEKKKLGSILEALRINVLYLEDLSQDKIFQRTLEIPPIKRKVYPYVVFIKKESDELFFINRGGRIRKGKIYQNLRNKREFQIQEILVNDKKVNSLLSNQLIKLRFSSEKRTFFKKGDVITKEEVLTKHHHYLVRILGSYEDKKTYFFICNAFKSTATLKKLSSETALISLHNPWLFFWSDLFLLQEEKGEIIAAGRIIKAVEDPQSIKKGWKFPETLLFDEAKFIEEAIEKAGQKGLEVEDFVLSTGITLAAAEETFLNMEREGKAKIIRFLPMKVISRETFETLLEKLVKTVEAFHRKNPSSEGMKIKDLDKKLKLGSYLFKLLMEVALRRGLIVKNKDVIALSTFQPEVSEFIQNLMKTVEELIKEKSYSMPLTFRDLELLTGKPAFLLQEILEKLQKQERIFRVDKFYFHREYIEELKEKLKERRTFTIQEFKSLTGFTRKFAIPLLEFLDSQGITRRENGKRRVLM